MAAASRLRLEVILGAIDKATGPFKRIGAGAVGVSKEIAGTRRTLRELAVQQQRMTGFRKLKGEVDLASTSLRATTQRAAALRREMAAGGAATRAQTRELSKLERSEATLRTAYVAKLRVLRDSRAALSAAGIGAREFGSHERRLASEVAAANLRLKEQERRLGAIRTATERAKKVHAAGMNATLHGAGMFWGGQRALRGAAMPVGAAIDLESQMADVRKVVDFDTPEQFAQMTRDIQDLSMRLPMASTEIAKIVAAAGQASIARKELLLFAEDAVKMGVAFDSTAEEAGATMATWRTAFRMGQADVVVLADKINYLGNTGPASVGKISEVVNRIGALGEVAGLQSGPLAALGATVAGMGIESEVSATGIKNMLLTLSSGEAATKKTRTAFKSLGLDSVKLAKAMQEDAGGAILSVLERLRELPKHKQAATMTMLFGRESIGAIAPMLTNLDLLRTNLEKVANAEIYAGSMEKEYASRVSTTANSLQLLKNGAMTLAEELGNSVMGDTKTLAERISGVAAAAVTWVRENPKLTRGLLLAAAGIALLVTVLGGLLVVLGTSAMLLANTFRVFALLSGGRGVLGLVKALGTLAMRALPAVGEAILWVGRALMANPIGLVLMAIAGLAYLIWKNWDAIAPLLVAAWDMVKLGLSAAWEWIKARAAAVWEGLLGYFRGLGTLIGGIFRGNGTQILQGLLMMWQGVNTMLGGLPALMLRYGIDMMTGLANGIRSAGSAVKDAVVSAVSGAVDRFKAMLGIRSPSRLFAQFGAYTMEGLAGGMHRAQSLPARALEHTAQTMRRIGAGIAVGASVASPAMAEQGAVALPNIGAAAPLGSRSGGAAAAAAPTRYEINIYGAKAEDARSIADQVREAIDRIEGERRARDRSALRDRED